MLSFMRMPLWGASRVEETSNLLGHALRKALGVIARQQGRGLTAVATDAHAPLVGGSSLQAALALDWDDPTARDHALHRMLETLTAVAHWLALHPEWMAEPRVPASLAVAQQVYTQDVITAPEGAPPLRQGVAMDRPITVEDAEMRHGRTSRSLRVDGDKRHILRDLDSGVVVAVGVTPAHAPEASGTDAIPMDVTAPQATLQEVQIDRASLASTLVQQRPAALTIFCKAWPVRTGPYFPQTALHLDWERHEIRCPQGGTLACTPGGHVQCPAMPCAACPLRPRCTASVHGRSVRMHPDARLLEEWRARHLTPQGRAQWRERIAVEHALAHIGRWQGRRARYRGVRKNVFDLRRCAVVHNLHVIARLPDQAEQVA
jgi:Transposase DDE domain